MFENVGKKLMLLAKVIFVSGLGIGGLYLLISLANYISNADFLEYATVYGGSYYDIFTEYGNKAYSGMMGILYSIILIVSSIISTWPIYGFGIIVNKFENENKVENDIA